MRGKSLPWRALLGAAVSLAAAAWAVWALDWRRVGQAALRADPSWLLLALATVLLTIAARAARWRGLLFPQRLGWRPILQSLLIGQVSGYFVSQLGLLARAAPLPEGSRARAMGAVGLEKLLDVAMLLGLTAALSLTLTLPEWLSAPARLLAIVAAVALLILLTALFTRSRWTLAWFGQKGMLAALLDGLEGLIRPRVLLGGLGGSLLVWGLGAATNYCTLRAFGLPASFGASLLLLAALQAGVAVPSLPASLGVFEGVCVAVLALFGAGQEESLAAGLVLHAIVFIPPIVVLGVSGAGSSRVGSRESPYSLLPTSYFLLPTSYFLLPTSDSLPPTVAVIIPVYNGAATLPACLAALEEQTLPPDEIIVVDDGSTDDTVAVARRFDVEVISQPNAGPAAARNRGARAAQSDVLLFTDADCAPAPGWVERMVAPFAEPTVAGVKGVYRTRQREWVARFVQAEYEDRYDRMRAQERIDFVDTYSAGYRREIFLAAGGFDVSFPTASVEDQEFSFRLAEAGHRLVFAPQAAVYHIHDRTLGEYARRKFWIGYWKVRVMREHPRKLFRDSHTPQSLKFQMGLAALGALLLAAGVFDWRSAMAAAGAWAGIVASGLPFILKLLRRDPPIALAAPLLLFVRAWALGLGFLAGLMKIGKSANRRVGK